MRVKIAQEGLWRSLKRQQPDAILLDVSPREGRA